MSHFKKYIKSFLVMLVAAILSVLALSLSGCASDKSADQNLLAPEVKAYMASVNAILLEIDEQTDTLQQAMIDKDDATVAQVSKDLKASYKKIQNIKVNEENKWLEPIRNDYNRGAESAIQLIGTYEQIYALTNSPEEVDKKRLKELETQAETNYTSVVGSFSSGDNVAESDLTTNRS